MKPLRITAEMVSRTIVSPEGLHFDALLMAAVARRDGLPPLTTQADALVAPPLTIPIERSSCGRFYLASMALGEPEARELKWVNRRFPLHEAIAMGGASLKRVALTSGVCKGFRSPVEAVHVPAWAWYAMGDPSGVRELLGFVTRLGRRRAVGEGLVRQWRVEECEPWGDLFPVASLSGKPLRHLPADYPAQLECSYSYGRCAPPYWLKSGEMELAIPCS